MFDHIFYIIILIIFSGFFIRIEQIPVWLRWAQYTCFLKFALNLVMIIEFSDCSSTDKNAKSGLTWKQECDALLKQSHVEKDHWWVFPRCRGALQSALWDSVVGPRCQEPHSGFSSRLLLTSSQTQSGSLLAPLCTP